MENTKARISVNNGNTYCTPTEAVNAVGIDAIVAMMDDEIRNLVDHIFVGSTDADFIDLYLALADTDLIIG